MDAHVNLLLEERHAYIWTTDVDAQMWSLTIGHVRRAPRRWRMLRNLLKAYRDMLSGYFDAEVNMVSVGGADADLYSLSGAFTVCDEHDLLRAKVQFKGQVRKVHTPFLSRQEVIWSENPATDDDSYIYVDASFFPDGPKGVPVSAYAIRVEKEVAVFTLNTALSSVEAEVQALQHAILLASQKAAENSKRYVVFSDCSVALTKIVLRAESDVLEFLGESVFVQWTPGHYQAVPGMIAVDFAARDHVRDLAGQY